MDFLEAIKEQEIYLKTPQNASICEPFFFECERIVQIAEQYKNEQASLVEERTAETFIVQYAVGGENLHRGFYNPSPTYDLTIGNCNRGKILSRITSRSKISYEYNFDTNHNLLLIRKSPHSEFETFEALIGKQNEIIGITFDRFNKLRQVTECLYEDGQIFQYINCMFSLSEIAVSNYQKEVYRYSNNQLTSTDYYEFLPDIKLLNHSRTIFTHDTDGYLSTYQVEYFQGEEISKNAKDENVYTINIRRRA
ncbi:MAG: hypothetical protein EOM06_13380 [Sphingobacteriia bacterium]|nr:hypothetical protein [Sphingobacteriia bacterium]